MLIFLNLFCFLKFIYKTALVPADIISTLIRDDEYNNDNSIIDQSNNDGSGSYGGSILMDVLWQMNYWYVSQQMLIFAVEILK